MLCVLERATLSAQYEGARGAAQCPQLKRYWISWTPRAADEQSERALPSPVLALLLFLSCLPPLHCPFSFYLVASFSLSLSLFRQSLSLSALSLSLSCPPSMTRFLYRSLSLPPSPSPLPLVRSAVTRSATSSKDAVRFTVRHRGMGTLLMGTILRFASVPLRKMGTDLLGFWWS